MAVVASAALGTPSLAAAQDPAGGTPSSTTSTSTAPTTAAPEAPAPGATSSTTLPVVEDDFVPPGGTTIPPTRRQELVPPPIDLTSLNQLLTSRREEAVAGATEAADAANAAALATAADARAALDAVLAEIPAADSSVESARRSERSAAAELERARHRKAELAVESYTLALTGTNAQLTSALGMVDDMDNFEEFVRTSEYSGAAWRSLEAGVAGAQRAQDQAEAATAAAIETRNQLERRVGRAQAALDSAVAVAQETKADGDAQIAEAAAIGEDLALEGLGPTILGETLLSPEDLAEFSARRSGAPASVDLLELARLFVLEGTAEGVRGDIAWAQSILETGNFAYRGSMVNTSDHNYAGIGACDSCSSGFRYDTPQLGVRAQMQLLHTYADDNLTSADLAFPPAGRAPERSSVRGCCDTWMELSGVWATGPGYGVKILTIYNEMLAFAAERQRNALRLVAASPPAP